MRAAKERGHEDGGNTMHEMVRTWLERHDDAAVSVTAKSGRVELVATWGGETVRTDATDTDENVIDAIELLLDDLDEAIDMGEIVEPR